MKTLTASRLTKALGLILVAQLTAFAQRQDPTQLTVLYRLPDMDKVEVRKDVTYKTAGTTALKMDVYTPPAAKPDARLPVVIFINGFGDQPNRPKLKEWGQYTSWPRLVAATGMVAVTYEARPQNEYPDVRDLIDYVRANAAALKVDENRVGLWSCSGNVLMGLPLALDESRKYIRGAVFYYGPMADHPTRNDVPFFIARAGNDNPQLNRSIDIFVKASLEDEVPVTLVSYVDAQHGFDLVDDTERSREIVKQTLDFLKFNLTRNFEAEEAARRLLTPPKFMTLINRSGVQKAVAEFEAERKKNPNAVLFQEQTLNQLGYQLLQQGRAKDAIELFKLNVASYPQSANVYDSLADGYDADGQRELAIQFSERALEMLAKQTDLGEAERNNIKASAEAKLKRLKGN
jgi:acetyl esterase/lipase